MLMPAKVNGFLGLLKSLEELGAGVQRGRQTCGAFIVKKNEGPGEALETVKCCSSQEQ